MGTPKVKAVGVTTKRKRQSVQIARTKKAPAKAQESVVWQREIAALESKVFSSLDSAVDHLIDAVVKRLGAAGARGRSEREFVRLLIETDPGLLKSISNSVKIRSK
jgi:hypothetical protein